MENSGADVKKSDKGKHRRKKQAQQEGSASFALQPNLVLPNVVIKKEKVDDEVQVPIQSETSPESNSAIFDILELVRIAGIKLDARRETIVTAFVLCHRYLNQVKAVDGQWMQMKHLIVATCYFMSRRVTEDQNFDENDLVNFFYAVANPNAEPLTKKGPKSDKLRLSIVNFEIFLLQTIQFNLEVEMPHYYSLNYLRELQKVSISPAENIATFCEGAHALLSDFYFNPSCILYDAKNIALAIVVVMIKSWPIQFAKEISSNPYDLVDFLTGSTPNFILISQIEKDIEDTFSLPYLLPKK